MQAKKRQRISWHKLSLLFTRGRVLVAGLLLLFLRAWISTVHFAKAATSTDPPYCQRYDGVLLISQGDRNGAAGTIFYLFILNQLLYAERHNLQPWIHLDGVSRHVYDPLVHGRQPSRVYTFPSQLQLTWDHYYDPITNKSFAFPGKPRANNNHASVSISVEGSGVWNSYFKSKIPITTTSEKFEFVLTQPCSSLPVLNLNSDDELVRGLHLACPYCARSWKYGGVPPSLKLPNNYHQWWTPMREKASQIVQKYYHPLQSYSEETNCLALHIRHSDKANKREKIPLAAFLPYCQAYAEATPNSFHIYLATDSSRIIEKIRNEWPSNIVQRMTWQSATIRSPNETAVFDPLLGASHDRTNREVFQDIQQMASCQWLLHGLSAVSEAVIYTNPKLHQNSVNLEFYTYYQRHRHAALQADSDAPMTLDEFRQRLSKDTSPR